MGGQLRKRVEVAVAVIFDAAGGKILICQRKHDTVLGGYWEFPGGKCNADETLEECAIREVREELGIGVKALGRLPAIEHDYPHARVRLHPFVCQHEDGVPQMLAVQALMWVEPGELGAGGFEFPPANAGLLKAAAGGMGALMGMVVGR